MIEYINKRMIDWATWTKRRADGGLGYPGQANFVQMVSISSTAGAGPVVTDAAAMEIERIVMQLRAKEGPNLPAPLFAVVYWVYLAGDLTMDRISSELGCHRDTVYARLHRVHLYVMDAMHEITIQAADRAAENKVSKALETLRQLPYHSAMLAKSCERSDLSITK